MPQLPSAPDNGPRSRSVPRVHVTFPCSFFPSFGALFPAYSCPMRRRDVHITLETPRLILRQFTADDVDNLFDLNSDPEVMRYLTGGRPSPREEIRDQILPFHLGVYDRLDRLGTWAAESTATGEFLGW